MMKKVNYQATSFELRYEPYFNKLELNLGSVVFYLVENNLYLNQNPYGEPNLTPIKIIDVRNKVLLFSADCNKNIIYFHIDCSTFFPAFNTLELIKKIGNNSIFLDKKNDEIWFIIDPNLGVRLTISNNNKRFILKSNGANKTITKRFPEPDSQYKISDVKIENNLLKIKTEGNNLFDKEDLSKNIVFEWEFNLIPEILRIIEDNIIYSFKNNF